MQKTVEAFGGIDICVNNASAISLTGTLDTPMKKYDLMHQVNARGTFLVSQACLPHLKRRRAHILNLSPPLTMQPRWFGPHVAYTMAKYGMSMCVLGMAEELKGEVAVNALWPRTTIATAAVEHAGRRRADEGQPQARHHGRRGVRHPHQGHLLHRELLHRRRGAAARRA